MQLRSGCWCARQPGGADLLALRAAKSIGIDRLIVLPYERHRFRQTSVDDRPGNWGPLYENEVADAARDGRLIELDGRLSDDGAFAAVNERILALAEATNFAKKIGVAVWEGRAERAGDTTAQLIEAAARKGFDIRVVKTI